MNTLDVLGLFGSLASLIGLPAAIWQIWRARKRIESLEQTLNLGVDVGTEASAAALSSSSGGVQRASQSVTQKVAGGQHVGLHEVVCRFLPPGGQEVYVSVDPTSGMSSHVKCRRLKQDDYTCEAEENRGRDCFFIDPYAVEAKRIPKAQVRPSQMRKDAPPGR